MPKTIIDFLLMKHAYLVYPNIFIFIFETNNEILMYELESEKKEIKKRSESRNYHSNVK